ncbi:MAG: hypothetical protein RKE49_03110 [Oceanicaulis sp.]
MTQHSGPSPVWISLTVSIGAYLVAALSIYLGYDLYRLAATGEFGFQGGAGGSRIELVSTAPGIGFALFGAALSAFATFRLIGTSQRKQP